MTIILLTSEHLADIEQQMQAWKIDYCDITTCAEAVHQWPEQRSYSCDLGRIPQPVVIIGEGVRVRNPSANAYLTPDSAPLRGYDWLPPEGWPAVGERVKCERCKGLGRWIKPGYRDGSQDKVCSACNGEGSTLPRVELTVTCQFCARQRAEPIHTIGWSCPAMCAQGTVPWGSAIWQTLPVVGDGCIAQNSDLYVEAVDGGEAVLWRCAIDDDDSDEPTFLFDRPDKPLRPDIDFVAILTDIEQP